MICLEKIKERNKRERYCEKLSECFESLGLGKYEKNRTDIFEILMDKGDVKNAIKNAKKLIKTYSENCISSPAKMKPATMIYKLI